MNRNTLRMAAVSAVAALALGAGSGLAQASEAPSPARGTQATLSASDARVLLANPTLVAELAPAEGQALQAVADGSADQVQARAALGGAAKALFNLMKKNGGKVWNGAKKAANKGWGAFKGYMDGLPWYHPHRIAWIALSGQAQYKLYEYINSLF